MSGRDVAGAPGRQAGGRPRGSRSAPLGAAWAVHQARGAFEGRRETAPLLAAPALVLVVLLAAHACARGDHEVASEAHEASVPGVETAPVVTAPIRDVVRAFGTVAAEAEPAEVRDARTALTEAEARRALAAQQARRLESLAGGLAPRKELDAARAEETSAAAAAARARNVLAAFGRDAERGALGADDRWVVGRVIQVDVPRVQAGAEASFLADAFPGERFAGRVDGEPAYVDPTTYTAPVRLRVKDPGGRLRPGMTGAVLVEVGPAREAVVVPATALVYDHAQPVVFVEEGGRYEPRPVRLGLMRDGRVEIAEGLAPGTRVVVTGASSLLSAARLPAGEGE